MSIDENLVTTIASTSDDAFLSLVSEASDPAAIRTENEEPLSVHVGEGSPTSLVMMGVMNDGDESMLKLHFEDVTEAINQLYNLASQIRSPRIRKYRTDIDLFKDVDDAIKSEYVKARTKAEMQGIEQMLLQSRRSLLAPQIGETDLSLMQSDQYLVQRLQKANHTRRQQFDYWRKTKKRWVRAAPKVPEPMSILIPGDVQQRHDTPILVQSSEFTRSLLSSAHALPKDFVLKSQKSTYTETSRGLSVHGPSGEKVIWPKPPVAVPRAEDFECPFCFYFCDPRYSEDTAWRFVTPFIFDLFHSLYFFVVFNISYQYPLISRELISLS